MMHTGVFKWPRLPAAAKASARNARRSLARPERGRQMPGPLPPLRAFLGSSAVGATAWEPMPVLRRCSPEGQEALRCKPDGSYRRRSPSPDIS